MTQTAELTLQDLAAVVNIIDMVSKRGAFEGHELLPVGQLRDKFARAVNEAQKAAQAAQQAGRDPIEAEADVTDPD